MAETSAAETVLSEVTLAEVVLAGHRQPGFLLGVTVPKAPKMTTEYPLSQNRPRSRQRAFASLPNT